MGRNRTPHTLADGTTPAGFGEVDRQLAEDLSRATSKEEADKIAQPRGFLDAEDAWDWLRERS